MASQQLAFIGMGGMGVGITKNLVAKGNLEKPIVLFNRTASKAEAQADQIKHAVVAESLEDAVTRSDIIWSCLQNEGAVAETFERMLALDVKGKLFLESSTILPEHANDLAARCIAAGAEYVAMPLFGDHTVANVGKLICCPAGVKASIDRILPYLEGVVAKKVINMSDEKPGTGAVLKIIGNILIISTLNTVGEVKVYAEKAGVGSSYVQDMVEAYYSVAPGIYARSMTHGQYYHDEPVVEVTKAQNLGARVMELARNLNVSLTSYQAALDHLVVAEEHGGSKCDVSSVYGAIRVESGLPFENEGHLLKKPEGGH